MKQCQSLLKSLSVKNLFLFIAFCMSASSYAWNATGHRLVAQIAYDYLTPEAKARAKLYNRALWLSFNRLRQETPHKIILTKNNLPQRLEFSSHFFKKNLSLINAAVWLDTLRSKDTAALKALHYIDIPLNAKPNSTLCSNRYNAVWALQHAKLSLLDPNSLLEDRGIALRIALHVIADLHQPLHAATRYNAENPTGDHGGNTLMLQKNLVATQLHAYWDNGGGALINWPSTSSLAIKDIAHKIEQAHPCTGQAVDLKPLHWAIESHKLALSTAYGALPKDAYPDSVYQARVQLITEDRIALAGCRLAEWMNQVLPATNI